MTVIPAEYKSLTTKNEFSYNDKGLLTKSKNVGFDFNDIYSNGILKTGYKIIYENATHYAYSELGFLTEIYTMKDSNKKATSSRVYLESRDPINIQNYKNYNPKKKLQPVSNVNALIKTTVTKIDAPFSKGEIVVGFYSNGYWYMADVS